MKVLEKTSYSLNNAQAEESARMSGMSHSTRNAQANTPGFQHAPVTKGVYEP